MRTTNAVFLLTNHLAKILSFSQEVGSISTYRRYQITYEKYVSWHHIPEQYPVFIGLHILLFIMEGALERIRYLTSSENRFRILQSLGDTKATRKALQETVNGSRSTVARVLQEAEARGWVRSQGSQYWLTPMGKAMVQEITDCSKNIEVLEDVGDKIKLFPPPLLTVDFRNFDDARIIETTSDDPTAPFTKSLSLFREANKYRGLTNTSLPEHARVLRDGVEQGTLDLQHVIEKQFVEQLQSNPERKAVWNSMEDQVWVFDGSVPVNFHIVDNTVLVWLGEEQGEELSLLESDNPEVLSWGKSLFSEYKAKSKPLHQT